MSFKEIISAVSGKPQIWMSSHPQFKNRAMMRRIWSDLSVKLRIEEEKLKKRWKHLKDQYRKELKKQPVFESGGGADEYESQWQYFEAMSFMRDEILPSKTTGILIDTSSEREHDLDETLSSSYIIRQNNSAEGFKQFPLPVDGSSQLEPSSSRKRCANSLREDILELEKKKLVLMEQQHLHHNQSSQELSRDEDYLYLMSILPSMKKLNDIQKLQFRGKINEWLLAEMTATKTKSDRH